MYFATAMILVDVAYILQTSQLYLRREKTFFTGMRAARSHFSCAGKVNRCGLDLAVLFTHSTLNRQNRNQVRWNTCPGVRRSTRGGEDRAVT